MCFSIGWLEQVIVWLIIVCAVVAIIRLLVPLLVGVLEPLLGGVAGTIGQIINIILYAFIAIVVVYFVFGLISCLLGAGGLHFPGPPGR